MTSVSAGLKTRSPGLKVRGWHNIAAAEAGIHFEER